MFRLSGVVPIAACLRPTGCDWPQTSTLLLIFAANTILRRLGCVCCASSVEFVAYFCRRVNPAA